MKTSAFVIAAPSSGSGKTTVTLALLRILSRRGLRVQPFKCGPDYLDTALHTMAASRNTAGKPGLNLDTFMASKGHVRDLFSRHARESDVSVVEGVMGLFDGALKADGSSAEIARLLDLPVVMVIDAHSMAYSAAPLLHGFRTFDPSVKVAGAIFNRVNSAGHYRYLEEAARDAGVEPLGYVPADRAIAISERHLGLNASAEYDREGIIDAMADHIEKTVEVDRLLDMSRIDICAPLHAPGQTERPEKVIAVARDEAFSFIYHENLEVLARYGEIRFFSPIHDSSLPEADLLYLAGGYPELHAAGLADNECMRTQIADYCRKGGAAWAECGGLMYLGRSLTLADGSVFPMCGALELDTTMQEARLTLGYRKIYPEGLSGREFRGHEFHYSRISRCEETLTPATVTNARDEAVETGIFRSGNTLATYIHHYWGESHDLERWLPGLA